MKSLLIGMKGQMDWPRPGAQMLVLEEPSGACSSALVKKPVRAQHTTQSIKEAVVGVLLVLSASHCFRKMLAFSLPYQLFSSSFFSFLIFKNKGTCFGS